MVVASVASTQPAPPPSAPPATTATADGGVVAYPAWKATRVEEARLALERINFDRNVENIPATSEPKKKTSTTRTTDQRFEQAKLNLEIARELTVNDYLAIYLPQVRSRDAIFELAKKMSIAEVAEILMAYQKQAASSGSNMADIRPLPPTSPTTR